MILLIIDRRSILSFSIAHVEKYCSTHRGTVMVQHLLCKDMACNFILDTLIFLRHFLIFFQYFLSSPLLLISMVHVPVLLHRIFWFSFFSGWWLDLIHVFFCIQMFALKCFSLFQISLVSFSHLLKFHKISGF